MQTDKLSAYGLDKLLSRIKDFGGKVWHFSYEERTTRFENNSFIDASALSQLKERAREAGLSNHPFPKSLAQLAISEINAQHEAFQKNTQETLPGLERKRQELLV